MIGVGVFRATGLVLRGAGSLLGATLLWLIVIAVCIAGARVFADLAAQIPEAGGPYAYVRVGFGRRVAALYGGINAAVSVPVRQAAALSVAGELAARMLGVSSRAAALAIVVGLVALTLLGVRAAAIGQRIFTAGKLAILVAIVVIGVASDGEGPTTSAVLAPVSIATALGAVWYCCLGWQDAVLLSEELEQPRRDLPAVMIGTVAIAGALYLAVQIAVVVGLAGSVAAGGDLPALALTEARLGPHAGGLVSAVLLAAIVGGAAETMFVRPRLAMAMARDGLAPAALARVSEVGTPWVAMLVHAAIVVVLIGTGSFAELLPLLVFVQGVLGTFECASWFAIRRRAPGPLGPTAPRVFLAGNLVICGLALAGDPLRAGIAAAVLVALAVATRRVSATERCATSPR